MGHIVLIGPIGVGKSTVAPLVAERLGRAVVDVDEARWLYYAEKGYDNDVAMTILARDGALALCEHWKPFEIKAVERLVADNVDAVLDFGAGHAHYDGHDEFLQRAVRVLAAHHVVLLLPSSDVQQSQQMLVEREPPEHREMTRMLNEQFVSSVSFRNLADATVFTAGRTPEAVASLIVDRWIAVKSPSARTSG